MVLVVKCGSVEQKNTAQVDVCTDWNAIFNVSGAHPRCSDLDNVKNAPTWSQRANRVRL